MIERGHQHLLRPANAQTLPDGRQVVHSICICSLEEQRITTEGSVTGLKYRFGGLWFAPLDLLRLSSSIGIVECEACKGDGGMTPCERCLGLGVTDDDGMALAPRDLKVG